MNWLVMIFSLVCAAVAQALLPSWTVFGVARPPILLGVVMYYALTRSPEMVFITAVLAGLLQDALSLIPFGYSACVFCVVAMTLRRFKEMVFVFRAVTHLILGAVASAGVAIGLGMLLVFNGQIQINLSWLVTRVLGALAAGAVVVPLVFQAIEWLDLHLGNIEVAH